MKIGFIFCTAKNKAAQSSKDVAERETNPVLQCSNTKSEEKNVIRAKISYTKLEQSRYWSSMGIDYP